MGLRCCCLSGGEEGRNTMEALDTFNTAIVSPIYYVMFTTLTIIASAIMFKDWSGQDVSSIASEICGFIIVLSGTIILHSTGEQEVASPAGGYIIIARAFILFMMRYLWFQTANDTVPLGYRAAVADLDSAAQYDWGSVILASLYHGLDTAVTTGGAITGFVQLLTYWFYEYCEVGHPIVKEEVKFSAYPRLRAWERGNRRKINDQATNLFILGRYHIDHHIVETITWEPWLDSTVSETEDVLTAKLICRKRMPLQVPNKNCEYYLGDRCWRQLEGEARIPLDPPLSMSSHISPAALHEMRQAGFLDCEQFVRVPGLQFAWRGGGARPGVVHGVDRATRDAPHRPLEEPTTHVFLLRRRGAVAPDSWYAATRPYIVYAGRTKDLQLRRGRDVRVVPLPLGGGAMTRQRGFGLRTRGGATSRRGRGTGDDYE
ncbi:hypothetical protein GIB67_033860 [Kingdonia uniflora]|uniref:Probable magnesium transporter n=1 Tax=Kingdonia uniflora TaxID=39325 RepID=A0A7J7MJ01_9MAGN|nr:hypothetical protein GIB67_033860 [Kingdonia uniflora]